MIADELGARIEDIQILQGDSAVVAHSTGTYASRSAVLAGGAATLASRLLKEKVIRAAAHLLEVADFLLAQGADINAIVPGLDMKATVLHRVATADGRFTRLQIETAIRFLLDRGADPAIRDEVYHSTPIGWACHFRQSDSVDLLIDRAGIHDAVGCDRPDRLRTLLAHDPLPIDAGGRIRIVINSAVGDQPVSLCRTTVTIPRRNHASDASPTTNPHVAGSIPSPAYEINPLCRA